MSESAEVIEVLGEIIEGLSSKTYRGSAVNVENLGDNTFEVKVTVEYVGGVDAGT